MPRLDLNVLGLPLLFVDETKQEVGGGKTAELRRWYNPSTSVSVIASIDDTQHGPLLHVSIARKDRLPRWQEITAIRDYFFPPDVDVMMVLPRQEDYVNLHPNAMHLWQMPMEWRVR